MEFVKYIPGIIFALDYLIRIGIAFRIIMRRLPIGVSLAWLTVVLAFPFFGMFIYLMIGEMRLGNRRAAWAKRIHEPFQRWLDEIQGRLNLDWSLHDPRSISLSRLAESGVGIPALPGNRLELLETTESAFDRLIQDIDAAERTVHLEFYIWFPGGRGDEVVEALVRARHRDVVCRVLVDAVGSWQFLKSAQAKRLRDHGVYVRSALPAGVIRMLFVRFDLRLHRKIVVVDGEIAYTGSMNLVDPKIFKVGANVGQWIDAMVRITGPAVEGLAVTFLEDWALETSESAEKLSHTGDVHDLKPTGDSVVHVVPSGPAIRRSAIDRVLLAAIYEAQTELIITTPYFVPDESLLTALTTASRRGVEVKLILPDRVDSKLVRLASAAYEQELMEAGVKVYKYQGGLLHTKSLSVDGRISLFGSLNLDPRSLRLNFEITLLIHCDDFASQLLRLQNEYIGQSYLLDLASIHDRSMFVQFASNAARLVGPLL